ncbi:MAG: 30S ribosomal protein S3 [Cyanobacteria bacterium NC_groundwater_1444_Ag_S-0.65um_54_12]|nr:30S ribosomal protein S3 [Cyanobacteria bacterium NC_groundwater_1444_Ag_S-0.65um_54_12]
MGQKIHPYGLRIGIINNWKSRWFASPKNYKLNLAEDQKLRRFIKQRLYSAGISDIQIERKAQQVEVTIYTAKPGVVVGRGGQGIDQLRKDLSALAGKKVQINIQEVAKVDMEAQLVAENVAAQLEKRIAFRRAMKQAMMRALKAGGQGIKIMVSGRLGGAEIARREWSRDGRIPLHTLRADINYGIAEAKTVYGVIGVKVWVYRGEVLPEERKEKGAASHHAHA